MNFVFMFIFFERHLYTYRKSTHLGFSTECTFFPKFGAWSMQHKSILITWTSLWHTVWSQISGPYISCRQSQIPNIHIIFHMFHLTPISMGFAREHHGKLIVGIPQEHVITAVHCWSQHLELIFPAVCLARQWGFHFMQSSITIWVIINILATTRVLNNEIVCSELIGELCICSPDPLPQRVFQS